MKEISALVLATLIKNKEPVKIVDVRTMEEIKHGTVDGAAAIPLHTIPLRFSELSKETPIVLICRSGARSAQATMYLEGQGFSKVFNLTGGMISWSRYGLEIGKCAESD